MKVLLANYECDPDVFDFLMENRMLSYCVAQKRIQACKLLITSASEKLDLSKRNADETSQYGVAFYNYLKDNNENTAQIMKLINQKCTSFKDYHSSQIRMDHEEDLVTPIYCII